MIQLRHKELSSGTKLGTSGHATANGTMKTLRTLLNFASDRFGHDDEPLIKVNPVSRLSRDRAWHPLPARQRIIADSKLADWYKALLTLENATVRDYLLMLLLTGFLRTESSSILWTQVDFDGRLICLPATVTKNHREHLMPMSDFLFDLLSARYERHRMFTYAFPGRGGDCRLTEFRFALDQVRDKSGCSFTIHDLRRTYLTMAEKLDVPPAVIKRLANHIPMNDQTLKYIILDLDRLRFLALR